MRSLRFAVLALTVGLNAVSDASQAPTQAPGAAVVVAQVVDATDGRPIPGAVVALVAGPAASTTTAGPPLIPAQARRAVAVANGEGRVVFREVSAGQYWLSATLEGFAPGASGRQRPGGQARAFSIADGARLTNLTVPMWRMATISGVVRDDRGEPMVGEYVTARPVILNGGRHEITFTGAVGNASDERGHFRISNLQPGTYVVGIRATLHTISVATDDSYHAAVTSGTTGAMMLEWRATGALGIQGYGVTVGGWKLYSWGSMIPLPAADGRILRYPDTFYPGAASASDATAITLAAGEDRSGVDFTVPLVPSVRVSGVLHGPEGPAANHGVRLVPAGVMEPANEAPDGYATTDAAGRFAFLGVAPGSYVVEAYRVQPVGPFFRPAPPAAGAPPGAARAEAAIARPDGSPPLFGETPVTVGAAHVDNLTVALRPGTKISGRVVFEGAAAQPEPAALQKVTVTIRPLFGTLPGSADARVDADGRFAFAGYPPGRYVLFAAAPPGPEWSIASFRVGGVEAAGQAFTLGETDIADAVLTFTDKTITLRGTVRAADGKSDPDATVVLVSADTEAWMKSGMSPRRTASVATMNAGNYEIRVALPGDYLVFAVPADTAPDVNRELLTRFLPSAVRVTLAAGESKTQPLTIARIR